MFAIAAVLSTLAIFAAAAPGGYGGVSQCNTGKSQCCNQVLDAKSAAATKQAGILGISLDDITGQVGFGCEAVNVISVLGGTNCAQAPVCCQGNHFNGLVNVGCNSLPIA